MTKGKGRVCRDCEKPGRPAPHPGPRCASHHRLVVRERKQRQHDTYVQNTYGLVAGEYEQLYQWQDGTCYICQRATGARRKLAVDHDHGCCPELPGCGRCVRGLLCKPCNRLLGHLRDNVASAQRVVSYLEDWPMRRMRDAAQHTSLPDRPSA